MNKIFRKSTGKIIDLGDDKEYKSTIENGFSDFYWLTINYKPVFSSRGEYLGFTTNRDFIEVS